VCVVRFVSPFSPVEILIYTMCAYHVVVVVVVVVGGGVRLGGRLCYENNTNVHVL
jgi:hypothetical protein